MDTQLTDVAMRTHKAGAEDLNRDTAITVVDLQLLINTVLGITACPA